MLERFRPLLKKILEPFAKRININPNILTLISPLIAIISAIFFGTGNLLLGGIFILISGVFDVFDEFKTPVDLITTSEVAVTLTIDDTSHLEQILKALKAFSSVEVEQGQTIICVVGDFLAQNPGMASRVFDTLRNIPISLISYGGSSHNITLLVNSENKINALRALQNVVTNPQNAETVNNGNTNI